MTAPDTPDTPDPKTKVVLMDGRLKYLHEALETGEMYEKTEGHITALDWADTINDGPSFWETYAADTPTSRQIEQELAGMGTPPWACERDQEKVITWQIRELNEALNELGRELSRDDEPRRIAREKLPALVRGAVALGREIEAFRREPFDRFAKVRLEQKYRKDKTTSTVSTIGGLILLALEESSAKQPAAAVRYANDQFRRWFKKKPKISSDAEIKEWGRDLAKRLYGKYWGQKERPHGGENVLPVSLNDLRKLAERKVPSLVPKTLREWRKKATQNKKR